MEGQDGERMLLILAFFYLVQAWQIEMIYLPAPALPVTVRALPPAVTEGAVVGAAGGEAAGVAEGSLGLAPGVIARPRAAAGSVHVSRESNGPVPPLAVQVEGSHLHTPSEAS